MCAARLPVQTVNVDGQSARLGVKYSMPRCTDAQNAGERRCKDVRSSPSNATGHAHLVVVAGQAVFDALAHGLVRAALLRHPHT